VNASDWSEGEAKAGEVRLHYYRTGGDKSPLVLAHGWTNSGRCWAQTARALEADYDIVMYDARGHGQSDQLGEKFGEEERCRDLVGLIEALGLKRPGLIGHSMGAATAANVAARHPDLPAFVVLEDPPWFDADNKEARAARNAANQAWAQWVLSAREKPWEAALDEYRAQNPGWSNETLRLRLEAFIQMDPRLLTGIDWDAPPWRETLSKISCPALLISGEPERGGIVTPAQGMEASTIKPTMQWVQIEGAGHNVRYDRFESYLEAVNVFLRTVTYVQAKVVKPRPGGF
jgi:pimeloyl-ACP methyl ester carboxylesterase